MILHYRTMNTNKTMSPPTSKTGDQESKNFYNYQLPSYKLSPTLQTSAGRRFVSSAQPSPPLAPPLSFRSPTPFCSSPTAQYEATPPASRLPPM